MNETLRAMQLLKDNYTLWEIDQKAILIKQKQAGHFIEGMESDDEENDFEEAHKNEAQIMAQGGVMMLGDDLF